MGRIVKLLIALLAVAAAAVAALWFLIDANQFRPLLEAELTKVLGREVRIADLKFSLWSGSVSAGDLSIAEDPAFGKTPFLRAQSLRIGVEMKPLIFDRKLNVTGLTVERPEIELVQSAAGDWNASSLGKGDAKPAAAEPQGQGKGALDLAVKLIRVMDGRLTVRQPRLKPRVFDKVNVEVRDFSPAAAFPFMLSMNALGAEVKLDGKAGPFSAADSALTPVDAKVLITGLNLGASGAVERGSGIAGLVSIDGRVTTSGRKVQASGKIHAEGLKLARDGSPARRPVELDFNVTHDVARRYGVLTRSALRAGNARAALAGSYVLRNDPASISLRIDGDKMAIDELVGMMPPLGLMLPKGSSLAGGNASAELAFEGPVDRLTVAGTLGLFETKLSGFDLASNIKQVAAVAGIRIGPDTDIQTLSAKVRSTAEGTTVEDLVFIAPAIGELTGSGTIGPRHELDFSMRVKLHTSGALMEAVGQRGDTTIPFFVRGTSDAPKFVPDMKTVAKEKAVALLKSEKVKSIVTSENPLKEAKGLLDNLFKKKKKE